MLAYIPAPWILWDTISIKYGSPTPKISYVPLAGPLSLANIARHIRINLVGSVQQKNDTPEYYGLSSVFPIHIAIAWDR
jgi:hypothetical protein